jgi:hypothetical protein
MPVITVVAPAIAAIPPDRVMFAMGRLAVVMFMTVAPVGNGVLLDSAMIGVGRMLSNTGR